MSLKLWVLVVSTATVALGLLELIGGVLLLGVAMMGFGVLLAAHHIVFEAAPSPAGASLRRQYLLEVVQLCVLFTSLLAALVALAFAAVEGWSDDVRGQTAIAALAALETCLLVEVHRRGDAALRWLKGSVSEEVVGELIDQLREQGWLVVHNVPKDFGGDVDHVLCGPNAVFVVETKSTPFAWKHAGQAQGNARFIEYRLRGVLSEAVTPIVCVAAKQKPVRRGSVWVMSREHIAEFVLGASKGRRLDLVRVERALRSCWPSDAPTMGVRTALPS
jgi:hypothetical protein